MILRKLKWILLSKLLCSVIIVESQIERSYDTNDWIPITPSSNANGPEQPKKTIGRVLNLDTPAQKFFPEDEYSYQKRKPQVQQYLRESSFKPANRYKHKNADQYRYEVPPQPQQTAPKPQYYPKQEVKLATYEQPPPVNQGAFVEKPILTRERAPAVNAPNLYEQYNLPFNSSFYQSLNPTSINQELQSELQNTNIATAPVPSTLVKDEKQSVQLLYVPLENLRHNQPPTQITQNSENIFHQVQAPRQENQIFTQNKQHLIDDIEHDLIQQTVQAHRLQQQIHLGRPVAVQTTTTTTTTPKPTKRKPHQPPLAVYLESNNGADTDDVLEALKDAKTIAVQDAVLPSSPSVFIGPSTLNLPSGYTRFPLPYINKLDSNRIDRKIENIPFFVAPLSYKTPSGYSKIPLPSPHVGSVVVSNKEDAHKRSPAPIYPNQISTYESTKPSYSAAATGNPNSQIFDPSGQIYYSTPSFVNPTRDIQKPQYLQFSVNDHVNQFPVSSKPTQEQLLQQPQRNINNIPAKSQPQIQNPPVNSFKNPEPVTGYNQASNGNASPQIALQHTVPDRNNNPYSSPLRTVNEDGNKYSLNQNVQSYQIPSRTSSPVSNTNQEAINPYQIPVKTQAPIPQYSQLIDNKKEDYSAPPTFSTDYSIPYHIPSKTPQRGRHPTTESLQSTGTPSRTTASHYDGPSSSFLSSQFDKTHEVSITPKTTTTTKPEESYHYPYGNGQKKQNPLDLAINQYELHQINSQLVEDSTEKDTKDPYDFSSHFHYDGKPKEFDYSSQFEVERSKEKGKYGYSSVFDVDVDKPKFEYNSEFERYSSTPATILRDIYEDITTTPKTPSKSRRRGKPSRLPSRTTTENPLEKESYTVLEEFSAKPETTPKITEAPKEVQYESEYKFPTQAEVADVPANVYRIKTTTPKYETPKEPVTTQYDNTKTVVENIPAKVYNLNENQNAPIYTDPSSQYVPNQNPVDKEISQSNFGRNEEVSHAPTFVQSPLTEVSYSPQYNENPVIEPLVHNRGQSQQENPYKLENREPDVPDYTSNLQDQSVRTLLVPNLLVPTTEHVQSTPGYEPHVEQFTTTTSTSTTTTTTTTTTTEKPVTRGRGRQRGGSRFSTASGTTTSVPRRTVNRRRPVHSSRTTTESPSEHYAPKEDIQKVNTRQRFRTRGRSSQSPVTERVSSTENEVRSYREPTSEIPSEIQTDTTGPQSYMQFEHTVADQKLVIQSEDTPITDFPQYYSPQLPVTITESPRQILQYDNTATTHNPIMDVQITHPVPKVKKYPVTTTRTSEENQIHLQSGGVLHNNRNHNINEDSQRKTTRGRGRARTRTRVATTTTERPVARTTGKPLIRIAPKRTTTASTTTTTQKPSPKTAAESEFFGFIRQPNFNQLFNIPVPSATEQPLQVYQGNQKQPGNTDVRVSTYQVFGNTNKSPNVRVQSYQIPQSQQPVDDIRLDFSNNIPSDATTVQFIGEIRPRYRPTTQDYDEIVASTESIRTETEPPRVRTRGRARAPQRTSSARQSDNEVSTSRAQQATRRSNVGRTRGRAHYRAPESARQKEDKDADVEGGNYPPSFFQNRQATANPPSFKISVGGSSEDDDQLPHASLYQPKVVPRPDEWTEATQNTAIGEEYAPANDIDEDINVERETVSPDEFQPTDQPDEKKESVGEAEATEQPTNGNEDEGHGQTDQPIALPVTASSEQTTENSDEAYQKDTKAMEELFEEINKNEKRKSRRRGVWKLVRQKAVDPYEVAESQNYYSVVNSFGEIAKVNDKKGWYDNGKNKESESNSDHRELYNNYNHALEQNSETYDYESQKLPSTESPERRTIKYYEVYDLNAETEDSVAETSPTAPPESQVNSTESNIKGPTTAPAEGSIFDSIYEMFGITDQSEDLKEPTTTTISSTEPETVPPQTTTTVASPTFPEEITEIPTTTTPENASKNSTNTAEEATGQAESTSQRTQITRTYDVEPWEMKAIRTSTSTEISHETEICYKGRCIKSTDRTAL